MIGDRYSAEERVTNLWRDFRRGKEYQASRKLDKMIPLCVRFYEGDQWAAPTKNTKNMPRPVINFIKMICRNKKSAILSTPVRLRYSTFDPKRNVLKYNKFAEYIQAEIGMEEIDRRAMGDAVKKGTYVYHYYWDAEARGMNASEIGGLRCELLEPLNVLFADPTEVDEQKQAWIMIATRESVKSVRDKADRGVKKDDIKPDEATDDPYAHKEQEESDLVTVLTRYFRKGGEVYCEKATKTTIINKAFPITPDREGARAKIDAVERGGEEDPAEDGLPDPTGERIGAKRPRKADLYPIVVGQYEPRDACIYGLGEVEGIIPNQMAVNFIVAMTILSAQENGWGKYIVGKDALRGQVITNEPGQVLTDHTPGGGGIRRLSDHAMPTGVMQIVDALTSLTRSVTGSSEVMTGETIGANQSGAAIAQIQAQALQPVEDLKRAFWEVKKKQGKVLAQFFRHFYEQTEFTYLPDGEKDASKKQVDVFSSSEFADIEFDVNVETIGGTNASVVGDINALEVALNAGAITPLQFFTMYPEDAISNRSEIIRTLEDEETQKVAMLTAQINELTAQIEALNKIIADQEDTVNRVDSVIEENKRLRKQLAELFTEARDKIRYANAAAYVADQKIEETTNDARAFATQIAHERGMI